MTPPGFLPAQEHPSRMSTPSPNVGSVYAALPANLSPQIREGSAPANIVNMNSMPAIPVLAQLETQASIAGANSNIAYAQQDIQSLQNLQVHQMSQVPAAGATPILQPNQAANYMGLPQTHVMSPQLSPPPIWNAYGMHPMARQLTPGAPGYGRQSSVSPEDDIRALRKEVKNLKSKINTLQSGTLQQENQALQQQVTQLTLDNLQLRNMLTHTKNEFERLSLEAQQKQNMRQALANQQANQHESFQSLYAHKMQNVSEQSTGAVVDPMQMQTQQSFVSPNGLQQPNNMYLGVTV